MTDDTVTPVDMDNLDSFSETFFGNKAVVAEPDEDISETTEEESPENEDDTLATDEDTDASESEETTEDETPDEEESEETKTPKKGKKSFQARIDEVIAEARTAQRERDALAKRLAEMEASTRKTEDTRETPKPLREQLSSEAPNPDAKDENDEPIYNLGEFDPTYIRDITHFYNELDRNEAKAKEAEEAHKQMVEAAQEELKGSWLQKLEVAEEEIPDIREKLGEMEAVFSGIDPNYGEFLAGTIMSCDNGPQIMYYLSQNIGEAQKIVASGASAATFALARLDAKFDKPVVEEKRNKKQSSAPKPPESRTRGSGGSFSTPVDTNDLNAFEREFYKK